MKSLQSCVFVVDDDLSMREALNNFLRATGFEVRVFENAHDFLLYDRPECPCCLILDMRMPGMTGIELQHRLLALSDSIPIIFVTAHADVPIAVRAMKAGAIELLPKPFDDAALLKAVTDGLAIDEQRCRNQTQLQFLRGRFDSLTKREREVIEMVVKGLMNKQIAAELGIAEVTTKVHRHNAMQKLEVRTLPDLIRMINEFSELSITTNQSDNPSTDETK